MFVLILMGIPILAALVIAFVNEKSKKIIRLVAVAASIVELATVSLMPWLSENMHAIYRVGAKWLRFLHIDVTVTFGFNGISLSLLFLTALLVVLSVINSLSESRKREKLYYSMILLLESALIGVFTARDFVIFYIFWEAVLIPMYFLIGIWGSERKEYAALKFFIYTFAGSVLMLVGGIIIYITGGAGSFEFQSLIQAAQNAPSGAKIFAFWLMFVGFAVKIPMFPFHTWLPDAHVQAPTAASVLLAGILLKMGGYGLIVLLVPMFPSLMITYSGIILAFGVVSIIYGSLVAFAQWDLKQLVAYSSVAHMGFVTAGIAANNSVGLTGAVYVMWAHGLITGMLFFLVGMTYQRFHTRKMKEINGLAIKLPTLGWSFVFAAVASLGLPGLAGFVGEFLTILGSYETFGWYAFFVAIGVLLNTVYLLKLLYVNVFTPGVKEGESLGRLKFTETLVIWVLIVFIVFIGVYPNALVSLIKPAL